MTGLFAGTWALLSQSANIISGTQPVIERTRQMTERVQRLLNQQDQLGCLSAPEKELILALQKRVECLVQPLNYLLQWSAGTNTAVQPVIIHAHQLLLAVCDYMAKTTSGNTPKSQQKMEILKRDCKHYLRELDFACQSVQLALTISQIESRDTKFTGSTLSPSAVLKASRRIEEMYNKGGDVCVCEGRLAFRVVGGTWEMYYPKKTRIKIVSDITKMSRTCFTIRLDPLFMDPDHDPEAVTERRESIHFGIKTASSMRLEMRGTVNEVLGTHEDTNFASLTGLLDGQSALLWSGLPSKGPQDPEFDFALLETKQPPTILEGSVASNGNEEEFAFFFSERSPGDSAFSPIDFVYVARLCALDEHAEGTGTTLQDEELINIPPHLNAADEVLREVLCPAIGDSDSRTPRSSVRRVRQASASQSEASPTVKQATPRKKKGQRQQLDVD